LHPHRFIKLAIQDELRMPTTMETTKKKPCSLYRSPSGNASAKRYRFQWNYTPHVQAIHGHPMETWNRLQDGLVALYGKTRAETLLPEIQTALREGRKNRPYNRQRLDNLRPVDWVKDEVVYMLYPERFGVPADKPWGDFDAICEHLPYLKELGVTTLYILPFMASPLGDAGFDVSDYTDVRQDLGGMEAFRRFRDAAIEMGFKLKSDLILNHISDQHAWFQAALEGDRQKMDYFVYRLNEPVYQRYQDPQRGVVCDYYESDGSISSRRLMFPDQVENHYRKVNIKGADYYFYHSFYPFQLDINWENPDVLLEVCNVIAFWANEGIDIFRLDAIPYLIKDFGTDGENRPLTHTIVECLSGFLQLLAPSTILQAEACQWPQDILPYFGDTPTTTRRSTEVQVCYHFPYMPSIWRCMLDANTAVFWDAVKSTPAIPDTCSWAVFLRVHDELTLEMTDIESRQWLYNSLVNKGQSFRSGLGVSGRLSSFMDEDPRRIIMAYAFLLSLPGLPIIYYGDELGEYNNESFAQQCSSQRMQMLEDAGQNAGLSNTYDSRDINRAPLGATYLNRILRKRQSLRGVLFQQMQAIVQARLGSVALRRGTLEVLPLNTDDGLLAYVRSTEDETVWVMINLTSQVKNVWLGDHLPPNTRLVDMVSDEVIEGSQLRFSPYEFRWFKVLPQ
jgi:maltose alpha-D-glucosyltransferase / alpha-amylase